MITTKPLEQELSTYFGFSEFMPGQKPVIEMLLQGKSAVAIFPTGSGKSLCYQLPALFLPGITLVVSPLLSLMKDQLDYLKRQKIPAARLDSTLEKGDYNQVLADARSGKLKILMISVERFKNERFRFQLKNLPISLMVVDEAHCISEWGHNFRPEYLKIPFYQKEYGIKQVLLLTATATEEVQADMGQKFNIPLDQFTITGFYRKNLFLKVTPVVNQQKDDLLLAKLVGNAEPAIVYVTLQKTAERIAMLCNQNSIPALPYHAGLTSEERESIQNKFMTGEIDLVVATIAFGMGIDKKNIRKIIHYDLPKSMENYSQEIGRAGRDQKDALCEVLANKDHVNILENFVYGDTPEAVNIEQVLRSIKASKTKNWEIKLNNLSSEVDIRILPLKTLLVYLEMQKIILPRYTYFEYYSFKSVLDQEAIANYFSDERKAFVRAIFEHSKTAKIWTVINFEAIIENYAKADRERIIKCLEFLEQKGMIELEAKIAVDVYEILDPDFNLAELTAKLYKIFKEKEVHEIKRIARLLDFFESETCLNQVLSAYFGEQKNMPCEHCSVCEAGKVKLPVSKPKQLDEKLLLELITNLKATLKNNVSPLMAAKFLCGITTPALAKAKLTRDQNFGVFENYRFHDVLAKVEGCFLTL